MLPQINYRLTQKLTYGKNIGAGLLMKMILRRCDRCGFSVLSLFFNVWVFRRADAMITDKKIIIKKCCNVIITNKKNNIKEIAIMFITKIRNKQDKSLLYPREMLTFNKNKKLPRLIPKTTFTKSNFKLITSPYHITKRSFSSLRILHTTTCSSQLSNSNFLWSFSRRFYPNKPKELQLVLNSTKLILPKPALTQISSSLIPFKSIRQHAIMQKIALQQYEFQNIYAFPKLLMNKDGIGIFSSTQDLNNYNGLTKPPIIINTTTQSPIKIMLSANTKFLTEKEKIIIINNVKELIKESKKTDYIFETEITLTTTADNICLDRFLFELCYRKLAKITEENAIILLAENNTTFSLDAHPLKIKITSLAKAYMANLYINNTIINKDQAIEPKDQQNQTTFIAICLKTTTNAQLTEGSMNHINVAIKEEIGVIDQAKNTIKSIGYLTGQQFGIEIAKIKFNLFQKQKQQGKNDIEMPKKDGNKINQEQKFVPYTRMKEIPINNIIKLKWGEDYFNLFSNKQILQEIYVNLKNNIIDHITCGHISPDILIASCRRLDDDQEKKKPYPKTEMQIKQDQINSAQIKEKNLKKKKTEIEEFQDNLFE